MPAAANITLTTSIDQVPGVGARQAATFRKLGIRGVADLLLHTPMRYEHELPQLTIVAAGDAVGPQHGNEANIAVRGEVATAKAGRTRKAPFEATLQDDTGTMQLLWFNAPWMRGKLHPGDVILVSGKAKRHGDYLQMANPKFQPIDPANEAAPVRRERYLPVYPATETLPSTVIHTAIEAILDPAIAQLDDHLHEDYRKHAAVPTLAEAYRMVHRPANEDEIAIGRRRLALDELLLLQLGVMLKRRHRHDAMHAPALKHSAAIDSHIRDRIRFTLTPGQELVVKEIVSDLKKPRPMNRLVQGDVGAGKTVIALYAMLMAVASGHQAALMAPTELLAEQHFASISEMLQGSEVAIDLLTGSLKPAQRRTLLERLEAGEIDLLIGTHALLTHSVNFKSLAVAVIDEQHRFGVHQRAMLRSKAGDESAIPHMLVMTATPIPRTMSLTVFGDLDISTIKGMPPGRQPIITKHVPQAKAMDVYAYVARRLAAGEQAYIVVPVIDETESGLKDVTSHLDWLAKGPLNAFQGKLTAMHGRLDRAQREAIMQRFREGTIAALVATTVIEVGVDVPNATMMIIEHADRFGLAQLHQLRGRVGRGSKKSLCVLIADPVTDDGKARIDAVVATADGFVIAEKDLEIRGPGEVFGSRQSGAAPFRVADLPKDLELLRMARRDAEQWIRENPTLSGPRDALLRKRLLKAHGESLGLVDVG